MVVQVVHLRLHFRRHFLRVHLLGVLPIRSLVGSFLQGLRRFLGCLLDQVQVRVQERVRVQVQVQVQVRGQVQVQVQVLEVGQD